MVLADLVVQRQRVVAVAPHIPHPRRPLDDQCIHAQQPQPGRQRQSELAAADNQDCGLPVFILLLLGSKVRPIGASEIAGIGRAGRAPRIDRLFVTFDLREGAGEYPRPGRVFTRQPQHAVTAARIGFETEDRLDDLDPQPLGYARGRPALGNCEVPGVHLLLGPEQVLNYCGSSFVRSNRPGEGEHVPPVRVLAEKSFQSLSISGIKQRFESWPASPSRALPRQPSWTSSHPRLFARKTSSRRRLGTASSGFFEPVTLGAAASGLPDAAHGRRAPRDPICRRVHSPMLCP